MLLYNNTHFLVRDELIRINTSGDDKYTRAYEEYQVLQSF